MNQDINEKIEEHLGDLKLIDVMYRSEEENAAVLVICVAGFLDGSREMQITLFNQRPREKRKRILIPPILILRYYQHRTIQMFFWILVLPRNPIV